MSSIELMIRNGRGRYRRAHITEVCEVAAQYSVRRNVGRMMNAPSQSRDFFRTQLEFRKAEAFGIAYLDNRHRLMSFEIAFHGTIDGASVHPREVVRRALEHNCAAVIFAHNHPSGVAEPSQADELITRRLRDALGLVDIRVLDHLVVGEDNVVSFAERGLI
jgi:DNA repair protein RadC